MSFFFFYDLSLLCLKVENKHFFVLKLILNYFRPEKKLPLSMTTPIPRPTVVRRPWAEYLKSNRERWIREAGKK